MLLSNYLSLRLILFLVIKVLFCEVGDENEELLNALSFTIQDSTQQIQSSSLQVPDEKWLAVALKDIAYFIRNHKFNDWDRRRLHQKPKNNLIGNYKAFPDPSLKLLHWKVHENCYKNFYKCIIYLHSVIETAPFTRIDDITTILNENSTAINDTLIMKLENECTNALLNADRTGLPFDSPMEKFQWRMTSSYFMCWYTMLGTPELSILGDICDNFANCLDPNYGPRNFDPRSDDRHSFACAAYSFCPDPCCPLKHVTKMHQCYENQANPCYLENDNTSDRVCKLDRKNNQNFEDMIYNKWNISCNCKERGFKWKSQFKMCVDINECITGENNCDNVTEECLNLPGTFHCICKWGFIFDNNKSKCIITEIFKESTATVKEIYYNNTILDIIKSAFHYLGL